MVFLKMERLNEKHNSDNNRPVPSNNSDKILNYQMLKQKFPSKKAAYYFCQSNGKDDFYIKDFISLLQILYLNVNI